MENVDSPEEKAWGAKMTERRRLFLANKDAILAGGDDSQGIIHKPLKRVRGRGRGRGAKVKDTVGRSAAGSSKATREPSASESVLSFVPDVPTDEFEGRKLNISYRVPVPISFPLVHNGLPHRQPSPPVRLPPILAPLPTPPPIPHDALFHPRLAIDTFPRRFPTPPGGHFYPNDGQQDYRNEFGKPRGLTLPPLHYVEAYASRTPPRTLPPLSIPPSPPMPAEHTPPTFSMPPDVEMMSPVSSQPQDVPRGMLERKYSTRTNSYSPDTICAWCRSLACRNDHRPSGRLGRRTR